MLGILTAYADQAETAAEATAQTAEAAGSGGVLAMLASLAPMILLFVLLYFIMIRPQKKQQKAQQKMRDELTVGDKIVTIGGICGKVHKIKDEYVYIETGSIGNVNEKSYIKMLRSAIDRVEKKIEA